MPASRNVFVSMFALIALHGFAEMEVRVAPLAVIDDSPDAAYGTVRPGIDLTRCLSELMAGRDIAARAVENPPAAPVSSYLEAARLCQGRGYGFLLYGYVKRSELSLVAEVKLLDAQKGEIALGFFNSDDAGHYPRLMKDLAVRIMEYFTEDLGVGVLQRRPEPHLRPLSLPMSLGYWTPATGGWAGVLAGLGSVSFGVRFIPVRPLFTFLARPWFIAVGVQAEYGLGMNQPGYESFFLHEARVRFPVELAAEMSAAQVLGIFAGPLLLVDAMIQDRLYASSNTSVTTVGGMSLGGYYRYSVSTQLSLGITTLVDIAFYANPFVTVSPRIDMELVL